MDVDALLRRLTSRQLAEWQAFWELEPFGQEWLRTAVVATAALSPWAKAKVSPDDFMPNSPPEEEQSDEEILAIFTAMASASTTNA